MSPQKIGRYKIKNELGRGGMAIVYLGHDPETDREVAVKVLQTEYLYRDTDSKARFRREIQTIARFEDPSIVQLYDVGEEDGQPYFVMRYMRGGSLEDKLKDGPLSIQEAFKLLEQIAPGLDEAHSKGVIHRDLKPGNILFDSRGKPSIADFGVAKIVKTNPSIVTNEGTLGTPAYMAPEQIMGGDVDGRADIYALGIILYQTLTGKLPFEAHMRNLGIATRTVVPSILDENPALPPWIESITTKAMAADRNNRFKTVGEMVEAIRMQMEGKPSPDKLSAGKAGALSRRAAIITGFVVIAAVLISVGSSLYGETATVTPTDAETADEFATAITSPSPTFTRTKTATPTDTPTAILPSPSLPTLGGADKVAFLNNNNIWIMNVDGSDLKSLTNDKTEKFNLQWLPDGKEILYITGKTIKTVNIDTKEESVITSFGASDYFEAFRISPDGKRVAISLARELHVLDFDLDQIKKATTKDDLLAMNGCLHYTSEEVEDVRWSKDGKKLAIKFAASTIKNLEDYIRIIDIQFCKDSRPLTVDEFPGNWFDFFTDDIISFDWNGNNREGGNSLFIMNSDKRNDGFGRLGIYNNASYSFWEIAPIDGICCYRDAVFSPDGSYVLFAFQDIRLGEFGPIQFYYQPYSSLETNSSFIPVPLPDGFFGKRTDSPSPVLRPAN